MGCPHPFPFSSIKVNFLACSVLRGARSSIHFRGLMFAGWKTLPSKSGRAVSTRRNDVCGCLIYERVSTIFGIRDKEDEDRRMFDTLRCCFILNSPLLSLPPFPFHLCRSSSIFSAHPSSPPWSGNKVRYRHSYYQTLNQPQERYSSGTNHAQLLPCHPVKLIWVL